MEDQLPQPDDIKELETIKPSYLVPVLLSSLITAVVLITGYLVFSSIKPISLIAQSSPSPAAEPIASPDPYKNWYTYSNSVHNVSFKYPLGWQLTKENDLSIYNASIKLTKDQATIHMIFGVDGIGGSGMDYEGTPFVLDGNKVFKYKAHNTYDNSESLGITDSLKESLGVLMLNKKTYVINLKYPTKYIESGESINLEKTFDQILSTFAFSGNKISESNMIHYVLKDKVSTIDYPKGWKIVDNTKQIDLYEDGKPQWSQDIELTLNDYKISSRNPLAWGPTACIFPDSPDYKKGDVYGEEYSSFTEFSNSKLTYRRSITSKPESEKQTWIICSKSTGGRYGGVSGFGASSYITPQSYDESTLSAMDDILMSMTNNIK